MAMIKKCSFFMLFFLMNTTSAQQWAWLYTKKFSSIETRNNQKRNHLLLAKEDTPFFSQMIFSWNSVKPAQGHFTFYAQVRDAKTREWHIWHKMIEWGNNIQKSYLHKGPVTQYSHVRLEVPKDVLADGVRIKIVPNNQADLSAMKSLSVTLANFNTFNQQSQHYYNHPSLFINNIPQRSQMILEHPRAEHMCSPTSLSMLISYLKKYHINPLEFALNVYDEGLDSFGSWPFNIAQAYQACEGKLLFYVTRLNSFDDLYTKLKQSIPVVVSVRGPLEGAPREFKNGHLILVIGWDKEKQRIMCHDPAFDANQLVLTSYDINSFCKAWARSHHLAYIAEPR